MNHPSHPASLKPNRKPFGSAAGKRRRPNPVRKRRLFFEALEDRWVLSATVIHVDTFADLVDPTDNRTSLREAIITASSNPSDYEIQLQAGTYYLTIAGAGEDFAQTGDLDIRKSNGKVAIVGLGAGQTIIDAGGNLELGVPALGDPSATN